MRKGRSKRVSGETRGKEGEGYNEDEEEERGGGRMKRMTRGDEFYPTAPLCMF